METNTGDGHGRTWRLVEHEPAWSPADLPINAAGETRPGFVCTHQLENGGGQCGGNVFHLEDAIGTHSCVVYRDRGMVPYWPIMGMVVVVFLLWYAATHEVRDGAAQLIGMVVIGMIGTSVIDMVEWWTGDG